MYACCRGIMSFSTVKSFLGVLKNVSKRLVQDGPSYVWSAFSYLDRRLGVTEKINHILHEIFSNLCDLCWRSEFGYRPSSGRQVGHTTVEGRQFDQMWILCREIYVVAPESHWIEWVPAHQIEMHCLSEIPGGQKGRVLSTSFDSAHKIRKLASSKSIFIWLKFDAPQETIQLHHSAI